jgi:succinate dehydrogenase flavin-adding protein (antitoxin of CptAB toxin-antitoxin module)
MPIDIWIKFTQLNLNELDDDCWNWINKEKKLLDIKNKKVTSKITTPDNILDV